MSESQPNESLVSRDPLASKAERMADKAHDPVIVLNHFADPTYAPYCMRCGGLQRMKVVAPFLWKHEPCGAVHDERQALMTDSSPSNLVASLRELSQAFVNGTQNRYGMRIPAEPDRDGDLVCSRAADEIDRLQTRIEQLTMPWAALIKQSAGEDGVDSQAFVTRLWKKVEDQARELARYESGRVVLTGEIDTLKQKLAYAEDAAAKGDLARQNAAGMDLLIETQRDKIQELEKKLSARLQQIEELRMAERHNVHTVAELQRERDQLRIKYANMFSALNSKQAKIDALMLEFCPGEMSAEQRADRAANQRPSTPPEAANWSSQYDAGSWAVVRESDGFKLFHFESRYDADRLTVKLREAGTAVTKETPRTSFPDDMSMAESHGDPRITAETEVSRCATCDDGECSVHPSSVGRLSESEQGTPRHNDSASLEMPVISADQPSDANRIQVVGSPMPLTHWSKDPLIPYQGCNCSSCVEAVATTDSDSTTPAAIDPMSCPHCDGIAPRGVLEHAPGCSAANQVANND